MTEPVVHRLPIGLQHGTAPAAAGLPEQVASYTRVA
jgi:hypothetical protein